ncbi:MAG TPA: tetratricopeptide repeat protein, partial [Pyrinomonadaceae bacterium]|nr:tetratricopeptide repeat protein [Pyrinomonadaceae bacterium]
AVQQYKGRQIDPRALGRELNVRAILLGRVLKRDNSIIVSAELIDTRDSRQMWGVQRPVKFSDFTLVPDEIVAAVSEIVGVKLGTVEKQKRDAEMLYVKGRNAWNKRTTDSINEAMGNFNQALALYPTYALAYAGLADCHNMLGTYGAKSPREAFPKAHDAAIKALAIDNNLAEAHAALAYTTFRGDWNWLEAEKEFKQAINLNDNYASTHQWYANYLAAQGRFDEAVKQTQRTQEIDKTSLIINSHFGLVYYLGHRFDDSITECKKTIELDPTFFVARRYLGLSYAQKGMYKEALAEFEKAIAASGGSSLMRAEYAHTLALAGDANKAQTELASLIELKKQKYISAYHIAAIYVGLKDKDRAFEWLETAFQDRADWMAFLKVDPRFDSLHSDPRFIDLLHRMNLG